MVLGQQMAPRAKFGARRWPMSFFENVSFGADRIDLPEKIFAQVALRAAVRAWSADKIIPICQLGNSKAIGS